MYGFSETVATMQALKNIRGKTIVISRSTFAGSGYHGGHWLGDNDSKWSDLYYSIPGILSMNMFGIPLVGADIWYVAIVEGSVLLSL
jgi:lysosomal alpha-glucosidase